MPNFKDIQAELIRIKRSRAGKDRDLFLAKEKLNKFNREKINFNRGHGSVHADLNETETALNTSIAHQRSILADLSGTESALLEQFKSYTDPRTNLDNLPDDFPALLFPVRLETRFKRLDTGGRTPYQLWVRIFPDECSIDTFEDIPSEAEIKQIQQYWSIVWAAGQSNDPELQSYIANQKKGAWKLLAGSIQAGRAYWLTENYLPLNQGDLPVRNSASDLRLIIAAEEIPATNEAILGYWISFVKAKNSSEQQAAFSILSGLVGGEENATKLLADYKPANLPPNFSVAAEVTVRASFINFPKSDAVNTKLSAWAQPAKLKCFPERFVLLGYSGNENGQPKQVLNEIGQIIPDPLIVGPNPSLDTRQVLKDAWVGNFINDTTTEQQAKLTEAYDNSIDKIRLSQTREAYIATFSGLAGEELTNRLQLAFDNLKDDVKAEGYIDYLCQRSETKWLFDFEEAVKSGMGFKVNLSKEVYENGFDRLFVLGVKLGADAEEGKTCLEALLKNHHYGASGFSILSQGTPTNNTETEDAGYSTEEDVEKTYNQYFNTVSEDASANDLYKRDGQWLSELLGVDAHEAALIKAENYFHTDQCEARAMNIALWNATIGYFMENMMTPVFTENQRLLVRQFFTQYVIGRGGIPSIRISNQPYGILPIGRLKTGNWLFQRQGHLLGISEFANNPSNLQKTYQVLLRIREDFNALLEQVAYVGKQGDAHEILLKALGLHPTSVEFSQRYAQSFRHLYNYQVASGTFNRSKVLNGISGVFKGIFSPKAIASEQLAATNSAKFNTWLKDRYKQAGLALLNNFGYAPGEREEVPILTKFFLTKENNLEDDLIDDQPFSEKRKIRPYVLPAGDSAIGTDYISWLVHNAKDDFDKIKNQEGFIDNIVPSAQLYKMLRHALTLGFSNTGFQVYQNKGILTSNEVLIAKQEVDFIGIQENNSAHISTWDYLDHVDARIASTSVSKHISGLVKAPESSEAFNLKQIIEALEHLKDVPTARLERAFVEHLDCCSYRLDAWLLGFVQLQLQLMRSVEKRDESGRVIRNRGIYLGAYGWVENLKAKELLNIESSMQPARLSDELTKIFNAKNTGDLFTDSENGGYIHAPSVNQAITAAVLRNAHITRADKNDDDTYKVNLSSERVRMALSMVEGMQQGQKLGALLGYQLERGLHDRTDLELDVFIYELRKVFPLMSNKNKQTEVGSENDELNEAEAITKMEARNVVDGLAFIEHINNTGNASYPFGFETGSGPLKLKEASEIEKNVINQEVNRLLNINDAIADLALSESVHQLVQSNYDRAAGTLETYSKGGFPQTPEVIKTPRSGVGLTHRFGIHLNPNPALSGNNIRAKTEPSINDFVAHILPNMHQIQIRYSIENSEQRENLSIEDLKLEPIDLLYIVNPDTDKNLSSLDDYILKWVHEIKKPRPNADIRVHYSDTNVEAGKFALFQILPLIKELKTLILAARPLKSTDIYLPNEAKSDGAGSGIIEKTRILDALSEFIGIVNTALNPRLFDKINDKLGFGKYFIKDRFDKELQNNDIPFLNELDTFISDYVSTLHQLNQFGLAQTGFGYVYERKREIYDKIYQKVKNYKKRWDEKLIQFDILIKEALAPGLSPEQQIDLLRKAERTISTSYTVTFDLDDPVGVYLSNLVSNKRTAFDNKLQTIQTWLDSIFHTYEGLAERVRQLQFGANPLSDFDLLTIETTEDEWQIVVLAEDIVSHVLKLAPFLERKITEVQTLLDEHDTATSADKRVKLLSEAAQLLFGNDFKVVPKFDLSAFQQAEIQKCYNDQEQLLKYQTDIKEADFPIDDWLYGISRVREKFGSWENLVVLSEQIKGSSLELTPLQFPYKAQDSWVALEYPLDYEIESDKLLYTAYFQDFNSTEKQCGLLIDEFTEVIPSRTETTGITFQHDQPNAEPPQTMLLALPSTITGGWNWDDLVSTLHEALDLAKLRAIEPEHIDLTAYGQFLPATVSAITKHPYAIMGLNYMNAKKFSS